MSLPVQGAWIEMDTYAHIINCFLSLPVQGAWIEMFASGAGVLTTSVAPRAGSVD